MISLHIPWVGRRRCGQPALQARLVYEAAGAGAAAWRDQRLGLAQVVADTTEGRGGGGRRGCVRRRIHQLREWTEGGADAAGNTARVQRHGDLITQQDSTSTVYYFCTTSSRQPSTQLLTSKSKNSCPNMFW